MIQTIANIEAFLEEEFNKEVLSLKKGIAYCKQQIAIAEGKKDTYHKNVVNEYRAIMKENRKKLIGLLKNKLNG